MADAWFALTIAHFAATCVMVGIIWTVQVVHYPLFATVGDPYVAFQEQHMRRISRLLVLPWGAETAAAALLVIAAPDLRIGAVAVVGMALALVIAALTALSAAPTHGRLAAGFDPLLHGRLMRVNAARTVLWTARGLVATLVLWWTVAGEPASAGG